MSEVDFLHSEGWLSLTDLWEESIVSHWIGHIRSYFAFWLMVNQLPKCCIFSIKNMVGNVLGIKPMMYHVEMLYIMK
jgi:hypothetical protein